MRNIRIMLDIEKIKAIRQRMGLSQGEAAKSAGLHGRQNWWAIESGTRTNVRLETLGKIAAALGVKARDLLR